VDQIASQQEAVNREAFAGFKKGVKTFLTS